MLHVCFYVNDENEIIFVFKGLSHNWATARYGEFLFSLTMSLKSADVEQYVGKDESFFCNTTGGVSFSELPGLHRGCR